MTYHESEADPIGCMIAQRIVSALVQTNLIKSCTTYNALAKIIYGEISDIASEQELGDWIETPNGSTYRLEFKPN